jgi:hypothetical protein
LSFAVKANLTEDSTMNGVIRRTIPACFLVAVCFAVSARPDAAQPSPVVARLIGTAVSTEDEKSAAGRIEIFVERWSTDADSENLRVASSDKSPGALLAALGKDLRRVGVVQVPGLQGSGARVRDRRARNIKFAREVKTATGRQIILVSDQRLGLGENPRDFRSSQPEFTLIDIRLGPDGNGVGKVAPASKVTYNKETRTLELENYKTEPVRLKDLRTEKP